MFTCRSVWLFPLVAATVGVPMAVARHRRTEHARKACPEHRSIIVIDITGFGRMANQEQLRTRTALAEMVRDAFRSAGCGRSQLTIEDRGDGMIVLVAAKVCKLGLLDTMVPRLAQAVQQHNSGSTAVSRVRLRVSMHAGEVHRDASGWASADLILACRLVDSKAAYVSLHRFPAVNVVFVVSDVIHHSLVRHRYRGIDPATYQPIRVIAKEIDVTAWLHVVPVCADQEALAR